MEFERGQVVRFVLDGKEQVGIIDYAPLESVPFYASGVTRFGDVVTVEFPGGSFRSLFQEYFVKLYWKRLLEKYIRGSERFPDFLERVRNPQEARGGILRVPHVGKCPLRDLLGMSVASQEPPAFSASYVKRHTKRGRFHIRVGYLQGKTRVYAYVVGRSIVGEVSGKEREKFLKRWRERE